MTQRDPLAGFPEGQDADSQIEWLAREQILRAKAGDVDAAAVLDHRYRILLSEQLAERNFALEGEVQALGQQLKNAEGQQMQGLNAMVDDVFAGMKELVRKEVARRCIDLDLRIEQKVACFSATQENVTALQRALRQIQDELLITKALQRDPTAIIARSEEPIYRRSE